MTERTPPARRLRRMRRTAGRRALVRETDLLPRHLVQPVLVEESHGAHGDLPSLPGQNLWSPDTVGVMARECVDAGLGGLMLFGIPAKRDELGRSAWAEDGVVQQAIEAVRQAAPSLTILCDLCLCAYTSHGHCGIVAGERVDNDATLEVYGRIAQSYGWAGADVVLPSGMIDGSTDAARHALDDRRHEDVAVFAYAAKFASSFYSPFYAVTGAAVPEDGRSSYQVEPGNVRMALRATDVAEAEGADGVVVKPAAVYLDVVSAVRDRTELPVVAFHASGEYAMLRAAAARGVVDGNAALHESVVGMRRAGADIVVTYGALDLAKGIDGGAGT